MHLYQIKIARRVIIPLLRYLNPGKIRIKHHYTHRYFYLDFFKHKGYWYHGKKREAGTMQLFKSLIKKDDIIIEIGGHIGYLTTYFSILSPMGKVYVFEPGRNNLPYLKANINGIENIVLLEKAVSDKNGTAPFYIEDLTGQNNSLLPDYEVFDLNKKNAFVKSERFKIMVQTITLDSFCDEYALKPDLIKIDIEGAELMALKGMIQTLRKSIPIIMVEITENWEKIFSILKEEGYTLFNENMDQLKLESNHFGNTFCFNLKKHTDRSDLKKLIGE